MFVHDIHYRVWAHHLAEAHADPQYTVAQRLFTPPELARSVNRLARRIRRVTRES